MCYPEEFKVCESSAEIELQALSDHTTKRILELQKEVIVSISFDSLGDLYSIRKWAFMVVQA